MHCPQQGIRASKPRLQKLNDARAVTLTFNANCTSRAALKLIVQAGMKMSRPIAAVGQAHSGNKGAPSLAGRAALLREAAAMDNLRELRPREMRPKRLVGCSHEDLFQGAPGSQRQPPGKSTWQRSWGGSEMKSSRCGLLWGPTLTAHEFEKHQTALNLASYFEGP